MTFPNPTNPPTIHLTRINFAASSRLKITGQQFKSTLADTLFIRSNLISVLAHYPALGRVAPETCELASQALYASHFDSPAFLFQHGGQGREIGNVAAK